MQKNRPADTAAIYDSAAPNAGGRRQFSIWMSLAARVGELFRSPEDEE